MGLGVSGFGFRAFVEVFRNVLFSGGLGFRLLRGFLGDGFRSLFRCFGACNRALQFDFLEFRALFWEPSREVCKGSLGDSGFRGLGLRV